MGHSQTLAVFCFVVALVVALPGSPALAGAWPREPGNALTIQSVELFQAEADDRRFSQLLVRTYTERGITKGFGLGGQLAQSEQESAGPGYFITASGVSEAELFASIPVARIGRRVSSLRILGAFATTKTARGSRVMGQDAAIGASWLTGFGTDRVFAEAETGYRRSLGQDADQLRFDAAAGIKHGNAMLIAKTHHIKSVLEKDPNGLDFDQGQLALSAVFPLRPRIRFEVGGRADVYARGFDPGAAVFISFWWTS